MKVNQFAWFFLAVGMAASSPAQTIITQPTNQIILLGGSATFNVAVSGTSPFYYEWQFNETNLPPIITTIAGNGNNGFSRAVQV